MMASAPCAKYFSLWSVASEPEIKTWLKVHKAMIESRGRVWLFMQAERQLKPVNLRLGISDGTNTELLSGELAQNQEVVTGVTGLSPTRTTGGPGAGNPLMPQGRGGPPGGGRGR